MFTCYFPAALISLVEEVQGQLLLGHVSYYSFRCQALVLRVYYSLMEKELESYLPHAWHYLIFYQNKGL